VNRDRRVGGAVAEHGPQDVEAVRYGHPPDRCGALGARSIGPGAGACFAAGAGSGRRRVTTAMRWLICLRGSWRRADRAAWISFKVRVAVSWSESTARTVEQPTELPTQVRGQHQDLPHFSWQPPADVANFIKTDMPLRSQRALCQ